MNQQSNFTDEIQQPNHAVLGPGQTSSFDISSSSDQENLSHIFYEAHQLIQQTPLYDVLHQLSKNLSSEDIKQEIKTECDDEEAHCNQEVSIINQPQMFLTAEEKCLLDLLLTKHSFACSTCCPVR